jgi:hypothetical protein
MSFNIEQLKEIECETIQLAAMCDQSEVDVEQIIKLTDDRQAKLERLFSEDIPTEIQQQVGDIVQKVLDCDQELIRIIKGKQDLVGDQLKMLRQTKHVKNAYQMVQSA